MLFPGVAGFSVVAPPTIGTFTAPTTSFDGVTALNLLSGADRLLMSEMGSIEFTVRVEAGNARGPFYNSAIASTATTQGGSPVATDDSEEGSDPDPNNDDNPDEQLRGLHPA